MNANSHDNTNAIDSQLTPAHLAEGDIVRVTYNSVYSDKRQDFEGIVTSVGGSFGSVTIDPEEDYDNGEPRIYVLGSSVKVDDGYTERRISKDTNPEIEIELLGTKADEDNDEDEADTRSLLEIIFEEDDPNDLYDIEHGDPVMIEFDSDEDGERVSLPGTMTSTQVLGDYGSEGLIWARFDHDPDRQVRVIAGGVVDRHDGDDDYTVLGTNASFRKATEADLEAENEHAHEIATDGGVETDYDGYCRAETTVDGEVIWCEKAPHHDGDHASHIPDDDRPGLLWDRYDWPTEPEIVPDGGREVTADDLVTLSRDEVADLEEGDIVTLDYLSTQDTPKRFAATVDKADAGAYYAYVFLTVEGDKPRTLHVYKSNGGTLYLGHDATGNGRQLSKIGNAALCLPSGEVSRSRNYTDLIESDIPPKPLAEGEHVETDEGVRLARLEGVHGEEFMVSAGTINNVVMDREEIGLLAELAGFEVEER